MHNNSFLGIEFNTSTQYEGKWDTHYGTQKGGLKNQFEIPYIPFYDDIRIEWKTPYVYDQHKISFNKLVDEVKQKERKQHKYVFYNQYEIPTRFTNKLKQDKMGQKYEKEAKINQ